MHNLAERYTANYPDALIISPRFTEESSACEVSRDSSTIRWRPARQSPRVNFDRIEVALDCPIHPSIKCFYQTFWCGPMHLRFEKSKIDLIQLWNEDDFEHLIENIFGHYLQQQRFKQAFTFFFATGDEPSEEVYSVQNETGHVVRETPGPSSIQVRLADDLGVFLDQLTCRVPGVLSA